MGVFSPLQAVKQVTVRQRGTDTLGPLFVCAPGVVPSAPGQEGAQELEWCAAP